MKKLMVLGAGILQLPTILKARELGLEVAAIDMDDKAAGIAFADKFFNISTIDIENVVKAAEDYRPNGIVTSATDLPIRSVAAAANKLNLPAITPETAKIATDKYEMIECFHIYNVAAPWYFHVKNKIQFDEITRKITPPFIIKPIDNSGSRGVMLVTSPLQYEEAYYYSSTSSRSGELLIEEYMTGPEVSVETFTHQNKTTILSVTDKLTTGAPYFVEMGHSQGSLLPIDTIEQIKILAAKAVESVGINMGPAHVEIIVTEEGPKVVELGARMGGDCITSHLVPLSSGVDMIECTILQAVGLSPNIEPSPFSKGSAIRFIKCLPGKITRIEGIEECKNLQGIKEVSIFKKIEDTVTDIRSSVDRIGYVISQGRDAQEAINICEQGISKINISVKEVSGDFAR